MYLQKGRQYPTVFRLQEVEEDLGIPTMKIDSYNPIEMQLPGKLKGGAEREEGKGVEGLSCVHSSMYSSDYSNQKIQWLPDPFST